MREEDNSKEKLKRIEPKCRKETLLGLVETWETKADEMLQGMVMNAGKLTVVTIRVVVTSKYHLIL